MSKVLIREDEDKGIYICFGLSDLGYRMAPTVLILMSGLKEISLEQLSGLARNGSEGLLRDYVVLYGAISGAFPTARRLRLLS